MSNLFVMSGMYSAGKTEFARKISKKWGLSHIDIDEKIQNSNKEYGENRFDEWMSAFNDTHFCEENDMSCVFDVANLTQRDRDIYCYWFRKFNNIYLIQIDNSFNKCLKNNKNRKRKIDKKSMANAWKRLEGVSKKDNERYDAIYKIKNDKWQKIRGKKIGFYGGKFMPMHKGHIWVIKNALKKVDILHLVMFINGEDELKIIKNNPELNSFMLLNKDTRIDYVKLILKEKLKEKEYKKIIFHTIDVGKCKNLDGSENWEKETHLVIKEIGLFDFVFSSEKKYDKYFRKEYPFAKHILTKRQFGISGTKIREVYKNNK